MEITRKVEFDMAHRLHLHEGKCRKLHGHRYVVEVSIVGDVVQHGPESGMVIDFSAVDVVLDQFVKRFDHFTMLYALDPLFVALQEHEEQHGSIDGELSRDMGILGMLFIPTAENLAQYFLDMLVKQDIGADAVRVWETPRSCAIARVPSS